MIADLALAAFLVVAAMALVRVLRGPTMADRIAALDVTLMALMCGIAVSGVRVLIDLLVVIAIIGFVATLAVSRYIERQGTSA